MPETQTKDRARGLRECATYLEARGHVPFWHRSGLLMCVIGRDGASMVAGEVRARGSLVAVRYDGICWDDDFERSLAAAGAGVVRASGVDDLMSQGL